MLFGVAALTVDMGYVRLSQAQMQNAADTAAIDINTRKVTLEDVKGSIPVQAPER